MKITEDFLKETPFAVTVCDNDGIIVYMNDKASATWEARGGASLIGKSLYDCHGERATAMIKNMLATGSTNAYTILKNGQKKLIYQSPWHKDGKVAGLIELSIVIPEEMPHFVRG